MLPTNYLTTEIVKSEINLVDCTLYEAIVKFNDYNQWTMMDLSLISGISYMTLYRYKYLKPTQRISKGIYNKLATAYNVKPNILTQLPIARG